MSEEGRRRTRELAEQERLEYCAECSEVFLDGIHGWRVRVICHLDECDHAHHVDEVWMADVVVGARA